MKISQQLKKIEKQEDNRPEYVKSLSRERSNKKRSKTPEWKAYRREYMRAYQKARCQTPEYKAYKREYMREYYQRKKLEGLRK